MAIREPTRELSGHQSPISALTWIAGDGRTLVSAGTHDLTVRLWEIETGRCTRTLTSNWSTLHEPGARGAASAVAIRSIAVSADGSQVFAGGQGDKASWQDVVVAWDRKSGWQSRILDLVCDGIALSCDNSLLVAGEELWDTKLEQVVGSIKGINFPYAFSMDGSIFAATLHDQWNRPGTRVALHETAKWSRVRDLDCGSGICDLAFSPDGSSLAVGLHEGAALLWDMKRDEKTLIGDARMRHTTLDFAPHGRTLAIASQTLVTICDHTNGRSLVELDHPSLVHDVAFAPLGRTWIATGADDGVIRIWDTARLT